MANWNERYMELSYHVASWSKDPKKKAGAIIADAHNRLVSVGYNGFPQGCDDSHEERYEKPQKYLYTEHAERNAIFTAAKNGVKIEGCSMYINWFPCADCSRAIIQSGISRLICERPNFNHPKWGAHFLAGTEMMQEAGVIVEFIN